ncbi:MAG: hypothetical protein NT007_01180 [Candidatus Kapabacteria bacterium]|nr:hypothetical protein [Candidatus Kapabacteria bacterium]
MSKVNDSASDINQEISQKIDVSLNEGVNDMNDVSNQNNPDAYNDFFQYISSFISSKCEETDVNMEDLENESPISEWWLEDIEFSKFLFDFLVYPAEQPIIFSAMSKLMEGTLDGFDLSKPISVYVLNCLNKNLKITVKLPLKTWKLDFILNQVAQAIFFIDKYGIRDKGMIFFKGLKFDYIAVCSRNRIFITIDNGLN